MPIQTQCPHCRTSYTLADNLAGKRVRCRECGDTFPVPADEEPERPGAVQARRPAEREDDEPPPPAPRRRRRRGRDGDEDWMPRRRGAGGSALLLGLIGGGALLVVVVVGCCGVGLWLGRGALADAGPWPEPRPLAGFPANEVVTLHISGVADGNAFKAIADRLPGLVDPGGRSATSSQGHNDRMTALLAPVRDPQALAQRIDFGTVVQVRGRVVTVVANPRAGR